MTKRLPSTLFISFVFVLGLFIYFSQPVHGSAPAGLPATVATSSNLTVSATALSALATSTCAARIVTTGAAAVMLTFSDYAGQTPTGLYGHLQAASTTVAYDSGLYGCGLMKVYSFATQQITVSETR